MVINTANQQFEATAEQYRALAARPISPADVGKYVRQVVLDVPADTPYDDLSTRKANVLQDVIDRYHSPIGGQYISNRPTWWKAYNAVTEHLSYAAGQSKAFGKGPDYRCDAVTGDIRPRNLTWAYWVGQG